MKIIITVMIIFALFFNQVKTGLAISNLNWAKNKFGIHVNSDINDLQLATELLNTNGGDWGWVNTVIREDELNQQQWQNFLDQCRRLHLIPIFRLATNIENGNWQKPKKENIKRMADFLNSLNWPIKDRFIIVFNEPNRFDEWGGKVNAEGYFDILDFTADYFHKINPDFYILSAGLDLAAPQKPPKFSSAENFYRQGYNHKPEIFEKIDGLASHSYPNYGFIGLPSDEGRTSIKGYIWELDYLHRLGIKNKLPVFITETGWPHQEGINIQKNFYPAKKVVQLLEQSFKFWLADSRVIAVTPFILNYPQGPFDHFSWINQDQQPYPQFDLLKSLNKPLHKPPQKEKIVFKKIFLPFLLKTSQNYKGEIVLRNEGESIWGEERQFCLRPSKENSNYIKTSSLCLEKNKLVEPGKEGVLEFEITPSKGESTSQFSWEKLPDFEIRKLPQLFPGKTIYRRRTGGLSALISWLRLKMNI